jgi:hypothetical protein
VVLQQGSIGQFDFLTLLLTSTASLSLLALATVLVDFLATNILANRKLYQSAKVQKTVAFNNKVSLSPFPPLIFPRSVYVKCIWMV